MLHGGSYRKLAARYVWQKLYKWGRHPDAMAEWGRRSSISVQRDRGRSGETRKNGPFPGRFAVMHQDVSGRGRAGGGGRARRAGRALVAARGGAAFGGFLEPQGGDFVGIGTELAADLALDAQHELVKIPLGGDEGVAGGVVGDLGADHGGLIGAQLLIDGGDAGEAVFRIVGGVGRDGFQRQEGVDVVFQGGGLDACIGWGSHGISSIELNAVDVRPDTLSGHNFIA